MKNSRIFNKKKKKIKKRFKNTFKISNNNVNKLILLLRKGVYHYEYMDGLEKFNETSSHRKEDFYSNLKMKDIKDLDYNRAERVCKDFNIKNFGEYHGLYLKIDTLLLAEVFENFKKMCLELHELDPERFFHLQD